MNRQILQLISTARKQIATSIISQQQSNQKIARTLVLIERSNVRIAKDSVSVRASKPQPEADTPLTFGLDESEISVLSGELKKA
jgi:hypothetical protein